VTDTVADDLLDAHEHLTADQRTTHISGRQYDRVFYSRSMAVDDPARPNPVFSGVTVRGDLVVRGDMDANHRDGYYGIPERERDISDHYPLITEFLIK
jgi:hypothetical protein